MKTNRRELTIAASSLRATLTDSIHLDFFFFLFQNTKSQNPSRFFGFGEMNLSRQGRTFKKILLIEFQQTSSGGRRIFRMGLGFSVELSIVSLSENKVGSSLLLSEPEKKKQSGGISTDAASH